MGLMNNWSMDGFEGCRAESVGLKKDDGMLRKQITA
jgi:hypothetical protein